MVNISSILSEKDRKLKQINYFNDRRRSDSRTRCRRYICGSFLNSRKAVSSALCSLIGPLSSGICWLQISLLSFDFVEI